MVLSPFTVRMILLCRMNPVLITIRHTEQVSTVMIIWAVAVMMGMIMIVDMKLLVIILSLFIGITSIVKKKIEDLVMRYPEVSGLNAD